MSNPQSTFNIGFKFATEQSYSVAPNSSTNGNWWQGGKWIPATVNATPDAWDRQATIFPSGRAGKRTRNNRRPVVGRRWSDGSFAFDVSMDLMPLVAYGCLGSMSANSVPSTNGASLLEAEGVGAGASKSLVLVNQPGDGGALLRIAVTGTSVGGWVSVSGIDADGIGASEVLSFSSAGSLYTRTSFSAIGASSIVVWSNNDASVSINGFQYYEYTVSVHNTSNPTFSIESHGDPSAGATSKMRLFPGMVFTQFELNTPAEANDGLMTASVELEGNPTATCNATSLPAVSPVRIWPAWVLSLTRAGISFDKALDFSFTFDSGNRVYRTAAGVQNPQGAVFLTQFLEGSMRVLLEDEAEYERWKGASSHNLVATWRSPYKLNTNNFQTMIASMTQLYYSDVSRGEDNDLQILEADFMTIDDADNSILKLYFKNNLPPSAYVW